MTEVPLDAAGPAFGGSADELFCAATPLAFCPPSGHYGYPGLATSGAAPASLVGAAWAVHREFACRFRARCERLSAMVLGARSCLAVVSIGAGVLAAGCAEDSEKVRQIDDYSVLVDTDRDQFVVTAEACGELRVSTVETPDTVRLTVLFLGGGEACIGSESPPVSLARPLGARIVVDDRSGKAIEISQIGVSEPAQTPDTAAAGNSVARPASSSPGASVALGRCDEFTPRYVGGGLTVSLPEAALGIRSGGTTEWAPINAGFSAEFAFDGVVVAVGRRVGTNVVPEPGFDQRVENGVVLFVKTADPELRSCMLDTLEYDAIQDEHDE